MEKLVLFLSECHGIYIPFLSNSKFYTWDNGIPTTDHSIIKHMMLNQSCEEIRNIKPEYYEVYGAVFEKFSIVSSLNYKNEVVILRGNNTRGSEVFLAILSIKGAFRSFLEKVKNNEPDYYLSAEILGSGEATIDLTTDKQIFTCVKSNADFISDTTKIRSRFNRFNFFNEEGKIIDCMYCSSELQDIHIEEYAFFKLKS